MGKYLDFENEEKGYEPFSPTKENIKQNIGAKICFVTTRDADKYRGTYFVRYGTIYQLRYSTLQLDEHNGRTIDIRDILECGIKVN